MRGSYFILALIAVLGLSTVSLGVTTTYLYYERNLWRQRCYHEMDLHSESLRKQTELNSVTIPLLEELREYKLGHKR